MDTQAQRQPTIGESLPWAGMIMDYTEMLAELIPEELLDWRPKDPEGHFQFSLAEILMHIVDARFMFTQQLTGQDMSGKYWSTDLPGADGVWKFEDYTKQGIIDSLKESRAMYEEWLSKPADQMTVITDEARTAFNDWVAKMEEQGEDVEALKKRGPVNIVRVVMAMVAHESGHRGSLYTLMRLNGVNLPAEG